jgi:hypothetical protein
LHATIPSLDSFINSYCEFAGAALPIITVEKKEKTYPTAAPESCFREGGCRMPHFNPLPEKSPLGGPHDTDKNGPLSALSVYWLANFLARTHVQVAKASTFEVELGCPWPTIVATSTNAMLTLYPANAFQR